MSLITGQRSAVSEQNEATAGPRKFQRVLTWKKKAHIHAGVNK